MWARGKVGISAVAGEDSCAISYTSRMNGTTFATRECDHFSRVADEHQQRRAAGVPTLSTLVGPVADAVRQWRAWAARCRRTAVVTSGGLEREWCEAWLCQLLRERDLSQDAERYLCRRVPESSGWAAGSLRRKTSHELALLFERAHLDDHPLTPDGLCRRLLLQRAHQQPLSADELLAAHLTAGEPTADIRGVLSQMLGLLEDSPHPALLIVPEEAPTGGPEVDITDARVSWLTQAIPHLAQLVTSLPHWTVGLGVDSRSWHRYCAEAPESFAKAVAGQHIIHLSTWNVDRVRQAVTARVKRALPELEPVFAAIARTGASDALVARLAEAACAGPECGIGPAHEPGSEPPTPPPDANALEAVRLWKSQQERFLFELLEHMPDLAGRFQLNAAPGFLFGNQPAEVDLLCPELKIAVEIDGYYHFTSADAYRRDRRKDLALQQHGFLVIRYLAEDVVPRMLEVVQSIQAAVASRQAEFMVSAGKDAAT